MWKLNRRIAYLAAAVGLGASLAAGAAAAQSWEDIVKAAEKEGEISVITPPIRAHRETIARFQEAYPKIKLLATAMPTSSFEPRVLAERKSGIYAFDAMVGGLSTSTYTVHIPQGWYVPLGPEVRPDIKKDELWLAGFDAGFMDKDRRYGYAFAANQANALLVDRHQIPDTELKSYDDLLDPKYKGKIAFYDPRIRGPGSFVFAQLFMVMGAEKSGRILSEQNVVLTKNVRQAVEWAVRGRYPIVIGAPHSNLLEYQKKGLGLQVKPLEVPERMTVITPAWGGLAMFSKAPHPNAARVFVNWLLSKDAQADWAKRGLANSRRTDVPLGLDIARVSESLFKNAINMSQEKNQPMRRKAIAVARQALKN